ncbi:hypothetical protein [Leptospira interrogans]|nr:hypothetical protein [Leptospira interrogans]QYY59599.1 hypothetical protein GR153_013285 [Leptospira interrogans serovar Bataviae]
MKSQISNWIVVDELPIPHIIITVFGLSGILFLVCKIQDTQFYRDQ